MSRPNILLVILDSVRAKNTSLHSGRVETTPNISELSKQSTWYTQARAPGIHSVASHASIFSGLEVEEHQLFQHESRLDPEASIWTTLSEKYGYNTGIFTPNVVVSRSSNLAEHFGHMVGPKRWTEASDGLSLEELGENPSTIEFINEALRHDHPIQSLLNGFKYKFNPIRSQDPEKERGEVYISEFLNWCQQQDEQWAACINLMDAHYPYIAQPKHQTEDDALRSLSEYFEPPMSRHVLTKGGWWALQALEGLYNECIRQADEAVKLLIEGIKQLGEYEDTLIVVTSDHGEAFGEYSQVSPNTRLCDHSWGIHEVQTHVPLIVKHPQQKSEKRINSPATLCKFPDVVESTIVEEKESFVPESGRVLSSTYRVPEPGESLPDDVRQSDYIGPWRAMYIDTPDGIIKKTTHAQDGASVVINSCEEWSIQSRKYPTEVDNLFDELTDANVSIGQKQTNDEIERQLEALGYMR